MTRPRFYIICALLCFVLSRLWVEPSILHIGWITLGTVLFVLAAAEFIAPQKRRQTPGLFLELIIDQITIKGLNLMVNLKNTQQVSGQLAPKDSKGENAQVESGSVSYTSSNEEVCTVEKDPDDETKFTVKANRSGVAQIDISADADLGEGVRTISDFLAVEVRPGDAVGLGVTTGEPEEQPAV